MKHEVYYDEEAGVLRLNLKGVFTKDDALELFSLVEKLTLSLTFGESAI